MAEDGEVFVAVGEFAAVVAAEDGALLADVAAVGEPGDVGVPGGVSSWLAVCLWGQRGEGCVGFAGADGWDGVVGMGR